MSYYNNFSLTPETSNKVQWPIPASTIDALHKVCTNPDAALADLKKQFEIVARAQYHAFPISTPTFD